MNGIKEYLESFDLVKYLKALTLKISSLTSRFYHKMISIILVQTSTISAI